MIKQSLAFNDILEKKFKILRTSIMLGNLKNRDDALRDYEDTAREIDKIKKNDKKRASYYNYYTNKVWGDSKSYDLCLDSSKLGIGGTAKAIEDYVRLRQKIDKVKL